MKVAIALTAALLLAIGIVNNAHEHKICDGARNYALCQLSLQAGDSDTEARDNGNL